MNRFLALAAAAIAVLIAFWHPAPSPAVPIASITPPPSQHLRKGHTSARSAADAIVYVAGAVRKPGLYRLAASARVNDAVQRAGGLRADADPALTNLAQHISDGEEIDVLRYGQSVQRRTTSRTATRMRRRSGARGLPPGAAIDINTADTTTLQEIPGIGATLAARIVAYRQLNGPFSSLDELADVAGMTQRRIDAIASYTTLQ